MKALLVLISCTALNAVEASQRPKTAGILREHGGQTGDELKAKEK